MNRIHSSEKKTQYLGEGASTSQFVELIQQTSYSSGELTLSD